MQIIFMTDLQDILGKAANDPTTIERFREI
jgi:hypothetical protein